MSATATRQAPQRIQPQTSKLELIDPPGMCIALPVSNEGPGIVPGASGVAGSASDGNSSFINDCCQGEGFDDAWFESCFWGRFTTKFSMWGCLLARFYGGSRYSC